MPQFQWPELHQNRRRIEQDDKPKIEEIRKLAMETLSHELVKPISKHICVLGINPLPTERKYQAS